MKQTITNPDFIKDNKRPEGFNRLAPFGINKASFNGDTYSWSSDKGGWFKDTSPEPSPIGEEVEPNYYACQLDKVRVGLTEYSPTIKVFANGNGEDTKHMSLNDESAKTLIQWLKNSFPNCED